MGRKPKALTNQKFGSLTVIQLLDRKNASGNRYWLCQCDCGNQIEVASSNLRSGHALSCGCNRRTDITNKKFDYLTALEPTENRISHDGSVIWKCVCDCGTICFKSISDLKTSTNNSCGCQKITSRGEQKIQDILIKNNIFFEREKIFKDCYFERWPSRFDFYVNKQYIIEFDGIQHYKDTEFFSWTLKDNQERDNYKTNWCKENNIPLIRIPYTHLNNLCLEDLLLETSKFIIK